MKRLERIDENHVFMMSGTDWDNEQNIEILVNIVSNMIRKRRRLLQGARILISIDEDDITITQGIVQ